MRTYPARSSASTVPPVFRVLLALAAPFVAALAILATYLHKELIVGALWMALGLGGVLFVRPMIGVCMMEAGYLLSAYPTLLQDLGFLTINNLLGACLGVLVVAHILETRDLSFLRIRQVQLLALIGVVLFLGVLHADSIFPLLQASRGRTLMLDRTDSMTHDFVTRLVFLVFTVVFARSRRDVQLLFATFMITLFAAVPSALVNWWQGNLNSGFRAVASMTIGANSNKLAMICLMEVPCWWFWSRAQTGTIRRLIGIGAVGASIVVLLVTGSRSGFLGMILLGVLLQTGSRGFRVSPVQIGMFVAGGALIVATLVPAQTWRRMITLSPEQHEIGGTSNMKREETVELAARMFADYPVFGVGLGNFREVSRQVYHDRFFRPPHNSYLWAASEGGMFVLVLYGLFFLVTWRDLQAIMRLAHRDAEVAHIAAAIRIVFLLFCFFSLFADLWLSPVTYILAGLIIALRRHIEARPPVEVRAVAAARRFAAAAA